jgi:hypothetical protein
MSGMRFSSILSLKTFWIARSFSSSATQAISTLILRNLSKHGITTCTSTDNLRSLIFVIDVPGGIMVPTAKVSTAFFKLVLLCPHSSIYGIGDRKTSAVVTDGICIGHPCCSDYNCKVPLGSGKDHFCQVHMYLEDVCAVIGCSKVTAEDKLTCDDPYHQEAERIHREQGQSQFQLHGRLQRACDAHRPVHSPRG